MSVGGALFIVGMVLFPLPVPFGMPLMIVGLSMMFKASDKVKRKVIRMFDKNLHTRNAWQKVRGHRLKKNKENIGLYSACH